ncbi:Protein spinster [Frankliniella fusca]|uniref:Protein spinster n=1 Tax=Frankliniella fusca TaxID=407009 RepID=A0AAE1GX53_9NEOP|nr:Protein spinster [Frankliniella fusca]
MLLYSCFSGVLDKIQTQFDITDDKAGLLQTAFVVSYMIFAPIFGYLGDRYNRKIIMAGGVLMWSLTTLGGSFMNEYGTFILFRAFVGIGEASYSTIAPTIISDMFIKEKRSQMLALFYFAIPIGSGLGYIVGAYMATLLGSWHWSLRLTPALGLASVFLIMFFMKEPVRGESEGSHANASHNSWKDDIRLLFSNKSFVLSTAGFTCVAFVTGALAFFGPKFLAKGFNLIPGNETKTDDVSFKFGLIAMLAGLIGVPLGPFVAQLLRSRCSRIDPLVCAVGLIISAPICFFAILTPSTNVALCYILMFIGELFLNLNWSIVADILLYVVPPTRRSSAEAYQILFSHALGDASSPYLIGLVSESLQEVLRPESLAHSSINSTVLSPVQQGDLVEFHSMQYALFITCFIEVLGGICFLLTAMYIRKDKEEAEKEAACDSLPEPTHFIANDPRER